ncbi:hypothetical protein Bca4012_012127 [Brassica carinata]
MLRKAKLKNGDSQGHTRTLLRPAPNGKRHLGSVYVDMKSDKGDCDACKEDESVNDNSCATCLESAKLNHFGLPGN